jgi:transcriptional regulator with XRE-family HTH domain
MAVSSFRHIEQLRRVRDLVASGQAREIRVAARLSQSEIAEACGVVPSAVSRWEAGERLPRGRAAHAYARLLDSLGGGSP